MHHYFVSENKLLTPSVRSLTLRHDGSSAPLSFRSGQYAAISLHDLARPTATRCFSIASSPTDSRTIQFCARVGGAYTSALERLRVGDQVAVRGPFGSFIFNEQDHTNLVFFAGGIGITPFMSMIRYAVHQKLTSNIRLIYSCRSQDDIPFFDELVALSRQYPKFRITFVVASGAVDRLGGHEVVQGRVDAASMRSLNLSYSQETYMICGPSMYMRSIRNLLEKNGVPPHHVLSEAFGQSSNNISSSFVRWPSHAYALSGISLLLAGFFVTESDMAKTLPVLQAQYVDTTPAVDITALKPQVDTNIAQAPIIKVVTKNTPAPQAAPVQAITQPAPAPVAAAPQQTVTPPAPKPTKTPTTRPRTRVS